jgi:hypothetical protein
MIDKLMRRRDVGLYRPIAALPGCNKLWTADMPDTKPICHETVPPEFVYPNVFFYGLQVGIVILLSLFQLNDRSIVNTSRWLSPWPITPVLRASYPIISHPLAFMVSLT